MSEAESLLLLDPVVSPLGSKVNPPVLHVETVNRHSLLNKLSSKDYRLTLIVAAAGFGKTTLLNQWYTAETGMKRRVAWLSLDRYDREPGRFVKYLISALLNSGLEIDRLTEIVRHVNPGKKIEHILMALCHETEKTEDEALIILDDYHLIESPEINEIVDFLIYRLPTSFRFAIASRSRPGLPLLKLMAQGQLLQIEDLDLRFSKNESKELFGEQVKDELHQKIYTQTDGWGIAMQMAKVLLAGKNDDYDAALPFFGGVEESLSSYLADQVFSGLSIELQDFLVDISFLENFCSGLADIVRGRSDSFTLMEQFNSLQALLMPLDKHGKWYRLHSLFTDFLFNRLKTKDKEYISGLYSRAATWYGEQGELLEAVRHATNGGKVELVDQIVTSAGGASIILTQGFNVLEGVLNILPKDWIFQLPSLRLGRAVLLCKDGRAGEASDLIKEVKASIGNELSTELLRDLTFAEMLWMGYADANIPKKTIQDFKRTIGNSDYWFQGWVKSALFLSSYRQGDLSAAYDYCCSALANYSDAESPYSEFFIYLNVGLIYWVKGDVVKAYRAYRHAERLLKTYFPADLALSALSKFMLSTVHYEKNNLDKSKALIDDSLSKVERYDGWVEIYIFGYHSASGVAFHSEGLQAALSVLDRAEETAVRRDLPRLSWYLVVRRIELFSMAGELDKAFQVAREKSLFQQVESGFYDKSFGWFEKQTAVLVVARLYIHDGKFSSALKLLGQSNEGENGQFLLFKMKRQLLSAFAYMGEESIDKTIESLVELFDMPCSKVMVRGYLDEGEKLSELVSYITDKKKLSDLPEMVVAALKGYKKLQGDQASDACSGEPEVVLTHRELDILRQLSLGYPNKLISRNLELSEGTVKFHLRNIYCKFGVNNRTEALAAAYRYGLI